MRSMLDVENLMTSRTLTASICSAAHIRVLDVFDLLWSSDGPA